jgi:hypothetical protein
MAVLWPSALLFDRVVAGIYPNIIDGTNSIWAVVTGIIPDEFDKFGTSSGGDNSPPSQVNSTGVLWNTHGGLVWFGQIIIIPPKIALGNLLSTQTRTIELFNSTPADVDYTTFVNNVGLGITILNQPMLPATIGTFNSIVLNVQISTSGPPTIEGTLDFTVDGQLLITELTGSRVVLLPVRPETPIKEVLAFSTDIIEAKDGTEQRIRIRDFPRQLISLEFFVEGDEAANLRNLLFDWTPRVWGLPIWWEERQLGADTAADDLTITVDTQYGDFRVGGIAILYEDQFEFEALEIASLTTTSLTFTSVVKRAHLAKDTTVLPVRFAYANPRGPSEKHLTQGQSRVGMDFNTIDNIDLSDASAFPTYRGQVLLGEPNLIRGANIGENWSRVTTKLDPIAGPLLQLPTNDRSKLATRKAFFSSTPQRLWEVRQLMHFLQGSVAPFYLPSFRPDMRVVANIGSADSTIDIFNIGFTNFVAQRQPFQNIRILLNDGTTFLRQLTGSVVIDSTTERLTIDASLGTLVTLSEIKRTELVALVRLRKDRVNLDHTIPGYASISMEVLTVQFDPA